MYEDNSNFDIASLDETRNLLKFKIFQQPTTACYFTYQDILDRPHICHWLAFKFPGMANYVTLINLVFLDFWLWLQALLHLHLTRWLMKYVCPFLMAEEPQKLDFLTVKPAWGKILTVMRGESYRLGLQTQIKIMNNVTSEFMQGFRKKIPPGLKKKM